MVRGEEVIKCLGHSWSAPARNVVKCEFDAALDGFCENHHPRTQMLRRDKQRRQLKKELRQAMTRIEELEIRLEELKEREIC